MGREGDPGAHPARRALATRMAWLMFARLVLAMVCLVLAVGVDGLGPELPAAARRGLYWTVAFAFLATIAHAAWFGRVRRPTRFTAVQVATDVAIATSLVYFSGGRGSIFIFLYVLVVVYGALVSARRGALAAAGACALAFGAVLVCVNRGWLPDFGGSGPLEAASLVALWTVHAGALATVGLLASALSRELEEAGHALDRSRDDLHRLRDLHERTIDSIMSGLLTTDFEGRITSFNPEAERITGVPRGRALGRDAETIIPGLRALVMAPEAGEGTPRRVRTAYRNPEGEELALGVAGSILRDVDGRPAGHVVIFQDVTRVVEMEAELRRSERLAAVGELSAKIAHEIRNPLAAISGSIQILRPDLEKHGDDEEPRRLIGIVLRETDRLNELIHDFLHYARLRPARSAVVALGQVVSELARMLETSLPESVSFEEQVEAGLRVAADPDQLRQVLWNLCRNALEAMPDGGTLRLEAHRAPPPPQAEAGADRNRGEGPGGAPAPEAEGRRWAEVVVSDTGAGIPPEVQDRIFEPFFTTKREGTGLGLATVHRIVENHGGRLQLRSEAGRGTVFRITLPRVEDEA